MAAVFRHSDLGTYTADASDLGLAPGEWPDTLVTSLERGDDTLLVRGRVFRDGEGDITHVEYRPFDTRVRLIFIVWND